jgi:hypothetical protein
MTIYCSRSLRSSAAPEPVGNHDSLREPTLTGVTMMEKSKQKRRRAEYVLGAWAINKRRNGSSNDSSESLISTSSSLFEMPSQLGE